MDFTLQTNLLKSGNGNPPQIARVWNFSANIYTKSENIIFEKSCFGFMFTNIGDTVATVNGMVIFPSATPATSLGDSRSLMAHLLDIYKGNITLAFAPGGANPKVEVVQLYYAESYNK